MEKLKYMCIKIINRLARNLSMQKITKKHKKRWQEKTNSKNGFGYKIANPEKPTGTLCAVWGSSPTLVMRGDKNPRYFTLTECKRIMGFGDNFAMPVSKTQAYRQLGNAVVPQVIEYIGKYILKYIMTANLAKENIAYSQYQYNPCYNETLLR